ncbi:MAG TPA: hypothetical protein VIM03_07920 [Thermoleophilaceae bacterium]
MSFLDRLLNRSSGGEQNGSGSDDAPHSASEDGLPIPGYDGLRSDEIVKHLRDLSQVQLEAVEEYERSHQDRPPVLDKLRYMRSAEPLEGYDKLDADEVARELDGADAQLVKAVRDYERKFQKRSKVLNETARLLPEAAESSRDAKSREEKEARVRASMRRAPGPPPD